MRSGVLRRFFPKGYGFITPADGGADFWFHISDSPSLKDESLLQPGAEVTFDLMSKGSRPRAVNVELV